MPRVRLTVSIPLLIVALLASLASAPAMVSEAAAQPSARVAYLIDYSSRTLDLVDLENRTVALGLEPVGDVPNQIKVRGTTAYVVNSFPEQLQIIDLTGPMTIGSVALGSGTNPWAVELFGNRAYVSLWGSDQVAVVDLTSLAVVRTIDVGVSPEGMCLAGSRLYVANSGYLQFGVYDPGTVSVIDAASDQVVATIPVGLNPQWCATDGEGEVHVVCSDRFAANNGRVFILDPVANAPTDSLWVGGFPGPIAVSSDGIGWMVEYGAGLLAIDTVNNTVLHDINNPVSAGGLGALGLDLDDSGRVHVAVSADGLLTVIAPDGTLADSFAVGPGPQDVALYEARPTPVLVTGFEAQRVPGGIELRWNVTGDDLIGCHVARRAVDGAGGLVQVTEHPIESEDGRFVLVDSGAGPGAIAYRLTGIAADGSPVALGWFPVAAERPGEQEIASPGVSRPAIAAWPNPGLASPGQEMQIALTVVHPEKRAEIVVFDGAGRAIRRLHRGPLAAGMTALRWDGRDAAGRPVPAGGYFIRMIGERGVMSAKVILVH